MNDGQIADMKHVGDAVSVAVAVGTLAAWLPPLAALLTIIWTGIRIIETDTAKRVMAWLRGN